MIEKTSKVIKTGGSGLANKASGILQKRKEKKENEKKMLGEKLVIGGKKIHINYETNMLSYKGSRVHISKLYSVEIIDNTIDGYRQLTLILRTTSEICDYIAFNFIKLSSKVKSNGIIDKQAHKDIRIMNAFFENLIAENLLLSPQFIEDMSHATPQFICDKHKITPTQYTTLLKKIQNKS